MTQAEGSLPAMTTGPLMSVGVAAATDRPRRGPEPADTSGGLLYRTRRADFTPLREVPGATLTAHIGLNDHGQITGTYIDGDAVPDPDGLSNTGHGFVQDRRGHTLRFDVSGSSITLPNGINNHGTIAGEYVDADFVPEPGGAAPPGSVHGFIRDRHGTISTFEVPYWRLHSVADINNRGQLAGGYRDASVAT